MARAGKIGVAGFFCLALASFGLAFCLPIYTDELGWKLVQSRMHLDGGTNLVLLPTCGPLGVPVPTLLVPFRWVDSLLYERLADPLFLRWTGTGLGLTGVLATALLLFRVRRGALSLVASILLVLSFATIGVMPFLIVMNRPEQILAIAIILLALPLIFDRTPARHTMAADVLYGAMLFVLCSFVMSEHPRGVFALPLMLVFVFRFVGHRTVAVLTTTGLVVMSIVLLQNWSARAACADPHLQHVLVLDNITVAASKGELRAYAAVLYRSWLEDPLRSLFIKQFQLKDQFTSDMFPGGGGRFAAVVRLASSAALVGLMLAGIPAFILRVYQAFRRRASPAPVLALASLWAFWAGSSIARVQKNDYEATVMMPVLILATLGSLWATGGVIQAWIGRGEWRVICRSAMAGLLVLSVVNQAALLWNYVPRATRDWMSPGFAPGQRFSMVPFGYGRLRTEILDAGALCGIRPEDNPRHLVLDEVTYYEYWRSFQPLLATYIDQGGWGRHIRDYRGLLKSIGSEGMVVGCQWVPDELREQARQNGRFCCVPSFAG